MRASQRFLREVRSRLRALCDSSWLWLQPDLVGAQQELTVLTGAVNDLARVVVVARGEPEARAMMAWLMSEQKSSDLTETEWAILEWRQDAIQDGPDFLDRSSSPLKRHSLRTADAAALRALTYLRDTGPLTAAWNLLEPTLHGSISQRTLKNWINSPAPEMALEDADLALAVVLGLLDNVRKQEGLEPNRHAHAQRAFEKIYLEAESAPVRLLKPQTENEADDDYAAPQFSQIFSGTGSGIYSSQRC